MPVAAIPLSPYIGLEITGVSGGDLPTREAAVDCLEALERHGVVVYREADISDRELVIFSQLLGEVVPNPTGEHEFPEIATITLDPSKTDVVLAWYRQGNFLWHIDGATDELPQKATLLTAREVDENGGDTEFASTYAAYAALPEAEKERIADLRVVHSFATAQRRAHPDATEEQQAAWARVPAREHPLVWTRQTGRKSLLLGATTGEVIGLPADEGRALLERLLDWSTQPRFLLRHRWRAGDLVIWDNTGMLHRATPFAATSRRLMHRTTLVGEVAVG
ncbi:taurine catabolism dioxygenase TauD [Parafrankia colletiae]|uniref:Taurine catabolism dioxygenase TauD n=1 Tax=Parafrankia colletiae TaxID=573497 RepID=A0A1S1Q251_9ACTN|nr:TauD/TfdA family dioxygenase [Parafrankia colletiae]MCK9904593.1 TauD/TfdA family dioxygenase [Frankia sp. Cpl3]OHV27659.1 taurine catabolism dioxygenase TauD [Parafrankia colletiae]